MTPARPISSPKVARMKSEFAANRMSSEWPWPRPVPRVPPEPNAHRACMACSEWTPGAPDWLSLYSCIGSSHAWTRCWTWGSKVATPTAPAADISRPKTIQLVRSVATYSMTTNMPKNSSDVPRSVSNTRMRIEMNQTTRIGPRSRPRGRYSPMKRRLASASASRFTIR